MNIGYHPNFQTQYGFSPTGKMNNTCFEPFSSFYRERPNTVPEDSFSIIRNELENIEKQIKSGGLFKEKLESYKEEISRLQDIIKSYKSLEEGATLLTKESEKMQKKLEEKDLQIHQQTQEIQHLKLMNAKLGEKTKLNEIKITDLNKEIMDIKDQFDILIHTKPACNNMITISNKSSGNENLNALLSEERRKNQELLKIISDNEKDMIVNQKQIQEFDAIQRERTKLQEKVENYEKQLEENDFLLKVNGDHPSDNEQLTMDQLYEENQKLQNKIQSLKHELLDKDDEINMYSEKQDELIIEFENKFTDLMMENEKLYSLTVESQRKLDKMNSSSLEEIRKFS